MVFKPNGQQFLVVGLLQAGLYKLNWTRTVLQGFLNLDFSEKFLYLVYLATIFRKNLEKIAIFSSFFLKIASVGLLGKTRYCPSTSTLFNWTRVRTAILGPRAYLGPDKKFENPVRPCPIYSLILQIFNYIKEAYIEINTSNKVIKVILNQKNKNNKLVSIVLQINFTFYKY